jgi:hypothetical protein
MFKVAAREADVLVNQGLAHRYQRPLQARRPAWGWLHAARRHGRAHGVLIFWVGDPRIQGEKDVIQHKSKPNDPPPARLLLALATRHRPDGQRYFPR